MGLASLIRIDEGLEILLLANVNTSMKRRIFWRSWSKLEAAYELERLKGVLDTHEWVDAHLNVNPTPNDIWFTTNGYDHRPGPFKRATWYAESYVYLANEYLKYHLDTRWNKRYHFNPNYCKHPNTQYQQIMCWWKKEKELFDPKKPKNFTFGMCLSKKPDPTHKVDIGYLRTKVVEGLKGRSFKYYGKGWDPKDPNNKGEVYVNGHRGTPQKFNDARILLADCKFVFCLENTHDEHYSINYLTEKIFHGFLVAAIPIYCGCWNIDQLVPADTYIDFRKFNYDPKAVADYCEKMSESDYKGYIDRIATFLDGKGLEFTCENRFRELDQKLASV